MGRRQLLPLGTSLDRLVVERHEPLVVARAAHQQHACFRGSSIDREALGYVGTTEGIKSEDVQDLMIAAVEHRFGPVNRLPHTIEWLTDNGSCYVVGPTRAFARELGLEPRTTPLQSPQSNGMAVAFVRTIKRDDARVSSCPPALGSRLSFTPRVHRGPSNPGSHVRSLRANNSPGLFVAKS
jgi:transposase InsO family protein